MPPETKKPEGAVLSSKEELEAAINERAEALASRMAESILDRMDARRAKSEQDAAEARAQEAADLVAATERAAAEEKRLNDLVEQKVKERIEASPAMRPNLMPTVPARPGTMIDKLDDESRSFVGALRAAADNEHPREVLKDWFKGRAVLNTGDGEGTGSSNADYLLPTGLSDMIVREMAEIVQFEPLCTQFTKKKSRGVVPKLSNVTMYSKAEGVSHTESTPTLSRDLWYAYSFGAFAKLTKETIEDSEYDIVGVIRQQFAEALAAEKDKQLLIGQNSDAPYGLYYTASLDTYALSGDLSYDALVELEHTIDARYRDTRRCVWVGSDTNLKRIRKIKDNDGRPIFERARTAGDGTGVYPTVLGYRYVNAKGHFPDTQMHFGMPEHYWVWNRQGLVVDLSEHGYDGTADAWLNDEMWLKIKQRFDGMVTLTNAWVKATGISG